MATFYPVGGGAPGIDPNTLTSTAGDILYPTIGGVSGNYNGVQGTLQLTGNAQLNHVLSGETFYTTNPKSKLTGTMVVQSILSFNSAPYSANQIAFTWQNPSLGPFSGVIIVGKTGGYPASISDGTRYYKGYGNNTGSGGVSNTVVGNFSINTTYYFRAFSYTTVNGEEWASGNTLISNTTIQQITQIITSSTIWSAPSNVNQIEFFCVGGGGGGGRGNSTTSNSTAGGGGGGGYTNYISYTVSGNRTFNITIGSGGGSFENGFNTTVYNNGILVINASGGLRGTVGGAYPTGGGQGGNGGSGGGGGAFANTNNPIWGGDGGSNGSNGAAGSATGGSGQGSTTMAFGNGTLYSGGGGGGGYDGGRGSGNGNGGSGGGGRGSQALLDGTNGSPNTGGGGGGGATATSDDYLRGGKSGGSGVCIIRYIT